MLGGVTLTIPCVRMIVPNATKKVHFESMFANTNVRDFFKKCSF